MGAFVEADIGKIEKFEQESQEAITEFQAIKDKFNQINETLLSSWKGSGAKAYKKETDHILEKIGGVKDVLDTINSGVIRDVKDAYNKLDEQLAEFNRNPDSTQS